MDHHAITRASRRIINSLFHGRVTAVDDSGPVQRVQVQDGNGATIDNIPMPYHYGFATNIPVGTDLMLSTVSGDRGNSVAQSSGHQTFRVRNLGSGETQIYTMFGDSIHLSAGRVIKIVAGAGLRIETPMLTCTGGITANCDSNPVHLVTHVHNGIQPGPGNTGAPVAGS